MPEPARSSLSHTLFTGFLLVACIILCVLVLLLTRENRAIKARYAELLLSPPGRTDLLQVGDTLAPIALIEQPGLSPHGSSSRYDFAAPHQRTLVLVLSTSCPHCETTIPVWNQILREVASPAVRIIGLQLDADSPQRLQPASATFEVRGIADARGTWAASLPLIPATLLVSPTGVVEHAWFGELSPAQQDELRDALIEASAQP